MTWIGIGKTLWRRGGGTNWSSYWATREPSALVLTVISDVRIDATWTDSAEEGADGYKVYISTDNATWTLHDTVAVGDEASSITGLTQATIYYVKVVAYKGTNESTGISDFQLTLAAAFVGGVANTKRYIAYDLATVTKDVNNYVTKLADKYSSGEDLVPLGVRYPLWTSDGIKMVNYSGLTPVLTKAFTLGKPYEIYVSCMLPTWGNARYFLFGGDGDQAGFRQITKTPEVEATTGWSTDNKNFPLNEYHVAYLSIAANGYGYFGVDEDASSGQNPGPGTFDGVTIGGTSAGNGIVNSIFRELIVRDVQSSDEDRAAIVRYLMNVNAFFF